MVAFRLAWSCTPKLVMGIIEVFVSETLQSNKFQIKLIIFLFAPSQTAEKVCSVFRPRPASK